MDAISQSGCSKLCIDIFQFLLNINLGQNENVASFDLMPGIVSCRYQAVGLYNKRTECEADTRQIKYDMFPNQDVKL